MAKVLTKLKIHSVASVDRGAGEDVKVVLMKRDHGLNEDDASFVTIGKRDFSASRRRQDASSGKAMGDGSFPIENKEDLANARRLVGHAKDPAAARRHIARRARALGMSEKTDKSLVSKLLGMFMADKVEKAKDALNESVQSIVKDDSVNNKSELLEQTIDQFGDHLSDISDDVNKALAAGSAADDGEPDGDEDMPSPKVKKALGLEDSATEEDIVKAIEQMVEKMDSSTKGSPKGPKDDRKKVKNPDLDTDGVDDINKMDLPESIRKRLEDYEEVQKKVVALEKRNELVELQKRASEHGMPEAEGETLQKAYNGDKAAVDKLLSFVKSATAAARAAGLFSELGATGSMDNANAYEQILGKAKEMRKSKPDMTEAQAFEKAYIDPENKDLVAQYKKETGQRAA